MARRNSRFVTQNVIIGNKSIQASDLTDSAKDEFSHDSAAVQGQIDANFASGFTVGGATTFNADVDLQDNDKLKLGTGNDLQIYHDGSNSYIDEGGTGALILKSTNFSFRNAADNEQIMTATANGAVSLYYDNGVKIATTSTGVDVSGTITDSKGDVRDIPQSSTTVTLVAADAGKYVPITANIAIPAGNTFSAGDAVTIYNNSASVKNITSAVGATVYLAGTATTGTRTLAQRGLATLLCLGSNNYVISGVGLA